MALGTCIDLIASKGTKVYLSTGAVPTGATVSGWDALNWTEIGLVESVGEFGPDSSIGSFTPIGTGVACKFMGTTDNGEISLTIAKSDDDGLAMLLGKIGNTASIPMKVELSDKGTTTTGHTTPAKGTRFCFPGLVKGGRYSVGTGDDVVKVNTSLVINGSIIEGESANSSA
jgi:hypothetical protein